jgi:hypothetical protein
MRIRAENFMVRGRGGERERESGRGGSLLAHPSPPPTPPSLTQTYATMIDFSPGPQLNLVVGEECVVVLQCQRLKWTFKQQLDYKICIL